MAFSQKKRVFHWLYRQNCRPGNFSFDTLLASAAVAALNIAPIDVANFVHVNAERYWNWLLQQQQTDIANGLTPIFRIQDRAFRAVEWWACSIEADMPRKIINKKISMQARPNILRVIDILDDRKYEMLGCFACVYSGASSVELTPPGNEGGVDFCARIAIPGRSHIFRAENGPLRIIGQCKKYKSAVAGEKVQLLVDTINDVKRNYQTVSKVTPPWFRASKGPIAGWLIAHSGFQSGSLTRAKDHGIITSDSIDLAEIFASARRIRTDHPADKRAAEFKRSFDKYCAELVSDL